MRAWKVLSEYICPKNKLNVLSRTFVNWLRKQHHFIKLINFERKTRLVAFNCNLEEVVVRVGQSGLMATQITLIKFSFHGITLYRDRSNQCGTMLPGTSFSTFAFMLRYNFWANFEIDSWHGRIMFGYFQLIWAFVNQHRTRYNIIIQ